MSSARLLRPFIVIKTKTKNISCTLIGAVHGYYNESCRLFHNQVQLSVTQRVKNQLSRLPFILFLLVSTTSWDNVCKGILHKYHYLTKYQYFITNTLMTILTLKMIHMRLFINLNESYLLNYRELESYIKQSIP